MARTPVIHHRLSHEAALAIVPFGTVTDEDVAAAMTPAGAWTAATLAAWGVPWPPPKGWRERLTGRDRASTTATVLETLEDRIRRIVREEITVVAAR